MGAEVADAGVIAFGLDAGVVHVDVENLPIVDDGFALLAAELVARLDALGVPVGPVDSIVEHGDGERVLQDVSDDGGSLGAIQADTFDFFSAWHRPSTGGRWANLD